MTTRRVIRSRAELVAMVPHMLGFTPQESLVCVPVGGPGPVARVDLPRTAEDRRELGGVLARGYQHAPGMVVLVAFTADHAAAEQAAAVVAAECADVLSVSESLLVDGSQWVSLTTGQAGRVEAGLVSRLAADAVVSGRTLPAASRDSLGEQLRGDPAGVAAHLPAAQQRATSMGTDPVRLAQEAQWVADTVGRFVEDQHRLSDPAAARMLAGIEHTELRDTAWVPMRREDAAAHVALWTDLTRRAPAEARTPAAGLLAFASWLSGDGARAWVAIDQIPDPRSHRLAELVATALQSGVPPHLWAPDEAPPVPAQLPAGEAGVRRDRPPPGQAPAAGPERGAP